MFFEFSLDLRVRNGGDNLQYTAESSDTSAERISGQIKKCQSAIFLIKSVRSLFKLRNEAHQQGISNGSRSSWPQHIFAQILRSPLFLSAHIQFTDQSMEALVYLQQDYFM